MATGVSDIDTSYMPTAPATPEDMGYSGAAERSPWLSRTAGAAELLLGGAWNSGVRIAGGVASVPFLLDSPEAALAVQQGFEFIGGPQDDIVRMGWDQLGSDEGQRHFEDAAIDGFRLPALVLLQVVDLGLGEGSLIFGAGVRGVFAEDFEELAIIIAKLRFFDRVRRDLFGNAGLGHCPHHAADQTVNLFLGIMFDLRLGHAAARDQFSNFSGFRIVIKFECSGHALYST